MVGWARVWALVGAVLVALATGCDAGDGTGGPAGGDRAAVQRVLDRRASAVTERNPGGFLAAADPRADGFRTHQRQVFRNLADVPIDEWGYRITRTHDLPPATGEARRLAVEARLRYRIKGYDTAPVDVPQRLTAVERDGRWYLAAESSRSPDGTAPARQLWEQGAVTAVRGDRALVLGAGQDADRLREIARTAGRAVPAADAAWRGPWVRRVVVLVPPSLNGMGELLGAPAAGYRAIAAVTTGEAGGSGKAPADRVIVNPEAYGGLSPFGRQVVLTHETTHVATRASTSPTTPLWLSEGFADWAAYRGTGRAPREVAPELGRAAATGQLADHLRRLPADEDFGFTGGGDRLATAYESSWLACRMIAAEWGEERLRELYRTARDTPADQALRKVLGLSPEEFTERWRAYAERELGARLAPAP
ncbi:hypothetical protein ACH429_15510 [Streptomyces pathocidini]|uniref:Lipoprotein n=1 Tax=Streptomyces pathocidini TaxID=1650571 RepID=A0ABW7USA0_9ACTN|nr:hypothetical protein [Streptomyces pathocidini]